MKNNIKDTVFNKTEELYNKLPLDKINKKLGGKIDVRSKKFKLIVTGAALLLIVLLLSVLISCFSKDGVVMHKDMWKNWAASHELDDETYAAYDAVRSVNKEYKLRIAKNYDENETFEEYIERCKDQYDEKQLASFNKFYEENLKKGPALKEHSKEALAYFQKRMQRRKYIEEHAPALINESLDESFDTCTKVKMDEKPLTDLNTDKVIDEWWNGVATLYNSETGKTKERLLEVKYMEDLANGQIRMVTTLSNSRP